MKRESTHGRLFAALAAVIFGVLCTATRAAAQATAADEGEHLESGLEEAYEKRWPLPSNTTKEEAATLNARWKALGEELKTTTSEFAATYRSGGDMRHSYLRWAPGGGFVYLYVYERHAVLDFSYGKVEVTPTAVVFKVEREQRGIVMGNPARLWLQPTPRRWVAARWRTTNYLVPEKEIAEFGMFVGGFGQYNDFNGPCCEFTPFMLSASRVDPRQSSEAPSVPASYARFMRRPVEATIRFVGPKRVVKDYGLEGKLYGQWFERASLTPVTIDAGRGRGLKPGLLLRLVGEPEGQYLKVTRVLGSRSEGVVVRHVYDDEGEAFYDFETSGKDGRWKPFPPVRVGTRVTSAPPGIY